MPDNASVIPAADSAVIHEISLYVYQTLIEIQQQQPELIKEKYRKVPWRDARNQSVFMMKLKEGLSNSPDKEALILRVKIFLQGLLVPSYFQLASFGKLIERINLSIQQLVDHRNLRENLHSGDLTEPAKGIAILLLDAENLRLDAKTEKFLTAICTYPIQIKIAFANWSKMGKQDVEFHGRGYELIHVPVGKDSADLKMATVGSSIFIHYPTAKEILVCSSDRVLSHLCTTLQTHGLTVYLVRKRDEVITVFNNKTNQTHTHSLKFVAEVPPLEQVIVQIKSLIKLEQKRSNNQWIKLSKISTLFQEKFKITLSQVVSTHFPGKRARDIFIENPQDFVVHQLTEQSEIYISLFAIPILEVSVVSDSEQVNSKAQNIRQINSQSELEQVLVKMIDSATSKSPGTYLPINILGTQFQRQYGQPVTTVIKKLQLKCNFIKFLQSCRVFELKQTDKGWGVALHNIRDEDTSC
ncbi:MAG: NYN domain-containing protein [Coleofasciculaceae cyanobacterium]